MHWIWGILNKFSNTLSTWKPLVFASFHSTNSFQSLLFHFLQTPKHNLKHLESLGICIPHFLMWDLETPLYQVPTI